MARPPSLFLVRRRSAPSSDARPAESAGGMRQRRDISKTPVEACSRRVGRPGQRDRIGATQMFLDPALGVGRPTNGSSADWNGPRLSRTQNEQRAKKASSRCSEQRREERRADKAAEGDSLSAGRRAENCKRRACVGWKCEPCQMICVGSEEASGPLRAGAGRCQMKGKGAWAWARRVSVCKGEGKG
jgi:hypothetical protein